MFTHYFKMALRNMRKHKTQSLTGIFGLAFGLACFVPALYWFRYETSYDNFYELSQDSFREKSDDYFYPDADKIYRVYSVDKQSGKVNELVSGILERKLREQFPSLQSSTVFFIEQDRCKSNESSNLQLQTVFTDSTFLDVFPQTIISGDAQNPLQALNNIILTESAAIGLFGDVEKAIGQTIKSTLYTRFSPYIVTAVMKDPPPNTNISFSAILCHEQLTLQKSFVERSVEQIWALANLSMYVKLSSGTNTNELVKELNHFASKLDSKAQMELRMMRISNIRHQLNADVPFTLNFIHILFACGLLLLISALYNFLNLYLDIFRQRDHELRLRTVHGASHFQLIQQMMIELTCAIFMALLLAGFLIVITRLAFSGMFKIDIDISQLMLDFVICSIVVMGLILFISVIIFGRLSRLAIRYQSKGKTNDKTTLRRTAAISQLVVSISFIVAALVVTIQMNFINHKDLGFDSAGIIHVSGITTIPMDKAASIMYGMAAIPQIENYSFTHFEPQQNVNSSSLTDKVEWAGKQSSDNNIFLRIPTDSRFASTFRLNMVIGKWLDELGGNNIVLNEEAVQVMGLKEPIGSVVRVDMQEYTVVGVVKDFHTSSLRNRILPTIFFNSKGLVDILYIRAIDKQEQDVIQQLNTLIAGEGDVKFTPLQQIYDQLNSSEEVGMQLFSVLATVCLLISLFGVYAVAAAATQCRRKEIAIRKVVGAEVETIVQLFLREYTLLVVFAAGIALPFAYLAMNHWLEGYAYRIHISWWLLISVLIGVTLLVLLTVLGLVLKAANRNPGEVVKNE
ncbi:ABC transporter permease [Parabacteroides sp. PF5-9]|uniref:ABC transporter permease n=1 Tax=Parabacteroides sp. PF5-9 TaxID=1742404 RepID=UPI002473DB3E|nr:ABC transporter permease [Parabacteroides sp. PF5-9]MDH6357505.1 putative ABC transport system permease protein [Parabacteroides sp. PF5-9]